MFRLNWKKGKYAEIHDPLQSRKGTDPKHLTFGGNFEMDRSMITTLLVLINYRCLKIIKASEMLVAPRISECFALQVFTRPGLTERATHSVKVVD